MSPNEITRERIKHSSRAGIPSAQDHRRLLTIADAAEYLGISAGTLRNWLSARRLAYVKVGRLTRISQSVLDHYIAEHTVRAFEQSEN